MKTETQRLADEIEEQRGLQYGDGTMISFHNIRLIIESLRTANAPSVQSQRPSAEDLLGAVARGWCHEKNANKVIDPDLAIAIAAEVSALLRHDEVSSE